MNDCLWSRLSRPLTLVALLAFVLTGCGGGDSSDGGLQLQAGERSPAIDGAQARFESPTDSVVVDSTNVGVVINVENFEMGAQTRTDRRTELANSNNGQHVHVIVDNEPYLANYESGTVFPLDSLAPGAHTLVTFPSRSYHESVKSETAYDVVNFFVGENFVIQDGGGTFPLEKDQPTIIYSRPKGSYSGAGAERIMFDFYLHNATLGPDSYKARYTVRMKDSQEELASLTLDEWAPAFMTGHGSGTYVITLELLDSEGNVVPGSFNTTQREVSIQKASS